MAEKRDLLTFIEGFESAVIGSIDEEGRPFSSYAPFVYHEHRHYIFISDIARHALNLKHSGTGSLFFIEDESQTANIFARKRISLQCDVTAVSRDEKAFSTVMKQFEQKFEPSMVGMLMSMQDFNLYAFRTVAGEATYGFGEAYTVGGEHMHSLLPRSGGSGHK